MLKKYLEYIGHRGISYLVRRKLGLQIPSSECTCLSSYCHKLVKVTVNQATSQSLSYLSYLTRARLRQLQFKICPTGIRVTLDRCNIVVIPTPPIDLKHQPEVLDSEDQSESSHEISKNSPESMLLDIIETWIENICNRTRCFNRFGRLTYYLTQTYRHPWNLTWNNLNIYYLDKYIIVSVKQCHLKNIDKPFLTLDNLYVKHYLDDSTRSRFKINIEKITTVSLTSEASKLSEILPNHNGTSNLQLHLSGKIHYLSIQESNLGLGIQGYGIKFKHKSTHWWVQIKYLRFIIFGQVSASIRNVYFKMDHNIPHPSLTIGNVSLRLDDTLVGFINRLSDLLPTLFNLPAKVNPGHYPTQIPTVMSVIHNYMDQPGSSNQDTFISTHNSGLTNQILINDYFNANGDNVVPQPPPLITYISVLVCSKVVCLVGNKSDPVAYFGSTGISYQICPEKGWKFRLDNGYIRDLSESYWDYLFYRANQHLPSIELKLTQQPNTEYGDKYNVQLELADSGWNIDETCLQSMLPFLQDINIAIQRVLNYLPSETIHITTCQVTSFNTIISYKPGGIDLGRLQRGEADEIFRLGTIRDTPLQLKSITLTDMFSLGELFYSVVEQWVSEISKKGPYLISQLGYLKYLLSPTVHLSTLFKTKGGYLRKIRHYTKGVAHDLLEMVGRTTVKVEETLDYVTMSSVDTMDVSKYSNSPNGLLEGLSLAQQHFEKKPLHQKITSSIRDTVVGIQTSIEKQHYDRVQRRYKH